MNNLICIVCPNSCKLDIEIEDEKILVNNAKCKRGIDYAIQEIKNPCRVVTTTIKTIYNDLPVISVKTDGLFQKNDIFNLMKLLKDVTVDKRVTINEIVVPNLLGTEVNLISTVDMNI